MEYADQLIEQDAATRSSFVKHHTIGGRASLFPQVNKDPSAYSGKVKPKLGEATRSKLKAPVFTAMVSYLVDKNVTGLKTATSITVADVNPPQAIFSPEGFQQFGEEHPHPQVPSDTRPSLYRKPSADQVDRILHKTKRKVDVNESPDFYPAPFGSTFTLNAGDSSVQTSTQPKDDSFVLVLHRESVHDLVERGRDPARRRTDIEPSRAYLTDGCSYHYCHNMPDGTLIEGTITSGPARPRARSVDAYKPDMRDVEKGSLSVELRDSARDRLIAAMRANPTGQHVYQPTDREILAEYHLVLHNRPEYRSKKGGMSKNKVEFFHLHLRYRRQWIVSLKRIQEVIFRKFKLVSTGEIPVSSAHRLKDTLLEAADLELQTLPKIKERGEKKAPLTPAEKKERRKKERAALALAFARTQPPANDVHTVLEKDAKFEQDKDDTVRITLRQDPEYKSFIRIAHHINYKVESTPDVQPSHLVHIELTHRNARVPNISRNTDEVDAYLPSHRILNVSDPNWESALAKLYPKVAAQKDYFKNLFTSVKQSGHKLYLVSFRHNEEPCTSNLFTHRQNMPDLYDDLRITMKHSPTVFMLIRGSDVDEFIEGIVKCFKDLAVYDPMTEIFVDVNNPYLNHKGVKPTTELPKFTTNARYTFETWTEYERAIGIGALIEQRYSMGKHTYSGKVAIIPIPGTWNDKYKVHFSYHLQLAVNSQRGSPSLVPGDSVYIDFTPGADVVSENTWHGNVTSATDATAMGHLNVIVNRPKAKETHVPTDLKEYSVLSLADLKKMAHPSVLRQWSRHNCVVDVTIFTKNPEKECKRLMTSLEKMKVPRKLRQEYPHKTENLEKLRHFLLCKDHTRFEGTPLFKDLDEDQWNAARPILVAALRPYQLDQLEYWENGKIFCETAFIAGPSGSGKSTLAMTIAQAYLLDISVPDSAIEQNRKEKDIMFQEFEEYERKKATKIADAVAAARAVQDGTPIPMVTPQEISKDASADTTSNEWAPVEGSEQTWAPAEGSEEPEKPQTYSLQAGRITMCGIQNDTVDEVYRRFAAMMKTFLTKLGMDSKLIIRLYGQKSEFNAVTAMIRPSYNPLGQSVPFNVNPKEKVTDRLPKSLLDAYLKFYRGNGNVGVRDRRMTELDGSAANYILELAQFPGFDPSPELVATFTSEELDHYKKALEPLILTHRDLRANGDKMNKELGNRIKVTAKIGMRALIEKAAVICTTASVATEISFNIMRQAHAVFLEEAGRANDTETIGFFSHYWNAHIRMFIGSTNQLPPMVFGDSIENPFQTQLVLSPLLRFDATGFDVGILKYTSRFKNQELLDLCAQVNNMPDLQPVDDSFDQEISEQYAAANKSIWGINSNLIFVNVVDATATQSVTRSSYSLETAAAVMKDAVDRMAFMQGKDHVIIAPYNAQVMVLKRMLEHAIDQARVRGDDTLAYQLSQIEITTIDSFMGKDRNSVTIDTTSATGHLWKLPRTTVSSTRGKVSCQFFGPTLEFTNPLNGIKSSHPIIQLIHRLRQTGGIRTLIAKERKSFEQYESVLEALGLIVASGEVHLRSDFAHAPLASAIVMDLHEDFDEEELQLLSVLEVGNDTQYPEHEHLESKIDNEDVAADHVGEGSGNSFGESGWTNNEGAVDWMSKDNFAGEDFKNTTHGNDDVANRDFNEDNEPAADKTSDSDSDSDSDSGSDSVSVIDFKSDCKLDKGKGKVHNTFDATEFVADEEAAIEKAKEISLDDTWGTSNLPQDDQEAIQFEYIKQLSLIRHVATSGQEHDVPSPSAALQDQPKHSLAGGFSTFTTKFFSLFKSASHDESLALTGEDPIENSELDNGNADNEPEPKYHIPGSLLPFIPEALIPISPQALAPSLHSVSAATSVADTPAPVLAVESSVKSTTSNDGPADDDSRAALGLKIALTITGNPWTERQNHRNIARWVLNSFELDLNFKETRNWFSEDPCISPEHTAAIVALAKLNNTAIWIIESLFCFCDYNLQETHVYYCVLYAAFASQDVSLTYTEMRDRLITSDFDIAEILELTQDDGQPMHHGSTKDDGSVEDGNGYDNDPYANGGESGNTDDDGPAVWENTWDVPPTEDPWDKW